MVVGFSSRRTATTLYLASALDDYADEIGHLGKHTTGKGCLYAQKLADVDETVLEEPVSRAYSEALA
jgi:hypothetical protein